MSVKEIERLRTECERNNLELRAKIGRIAELESELAACKTALSDLIDLQNGPPLIRDKEAWGIAMTKAFCCLQPPLPKGAKT